MSTIEIKVPDIGDFTDVPVIEIFVKPGDVVKAEDSLVTLESDKATMDVPSPAAGTVKEVKVKLGDKVAEGMVILTLDADAPSPQPSPAGGRGSTRSAPSPQAVPSPQPSPASGRGSSSGSPPVADPAAPALPLPRAGEGRG